MHAMYYMLVYPQSVHAEQQCALREATLGQFTPGIYVLDFGSVVVNQSKTRIVQLRNAASYAFSIKLGKKVWKLLLCMYKHQHYKQQLQQL